MSYLAYFALFLWMSIFIGAIREPDTDTILIYPENSAVIDSSHDIYLTYEADGLVCVHSDKFDGYHEIFWCSLPRPGIEHYSIPSMRTPVNNHLKTRLGSANNKKLGKTKQQQLALKKRALDETLLKSAGIFEILPDGMEYDVEFVDPMEEVKWVCSTIVWKCREEMHQNALIPQIEGMRSTLGVNVNSASTPRLNNSEYNALKDLYYSLGGENWQLIIPDAIYMSLQPYFGYMWNFTGSSQDHNPCLERWMGIVCDCSYGAAVHILDDPANTANYYYYNNYQGPYFSTASECHVIKLGLRGFIDSVNGTIPDSISNLTYLTHLHISGGFYRPVGVFGKLPYSLSTLTNLKALSLSLNHIASIPEEVGNLRNLVFLSFTFCKLTGTTIPSTIQSLKSLRYFYSTGN